jgi:hypothetical protein
MDVDKCTNMIPTCSSRRSKQEVKAIVPSLDILNKIVFRMGHFHLHWAGWSPRIRYSYERRPLAGVRAFGRFIVHIN